MAHPCVDALKQSAHQRQPTSSILGISVCQVRVERAFRRASKRRKDHESAFSRRHICRRLKAGSTVKGERLDAALKRGCYRTSRITLLP